MAARQPRTHWTHTEDVWLVQVKEMLGPDKDWEYISQFVPGRTAMSCKNRWSDQLSPAVLADPFTPEEDRIIFWSHDKIGKKWARIARRLNGRTGNSVRNYWRCVMKRKYASMTYRQFNEFMSTGTFGAVFGSFENPFNPTNLELSLAIV
ncbi:transcription factor MYB44-like [Bidens hawaiensis]|uniref:transcription factor MYB44-like n=1 Tax=Bidens hawaiensis TaxID=980011 RepID=UPI00404B717A